MKNPINENIPATYLQISLNYSLKGKIGSDKLSLSEVNNYFLHRLVISL